MSYSLQVSCFEISQVPERQSDYEFVRADNTAPPELKQWIRTNIHKPLADPLIKSEALIIASCSFAVSNETYVCVCRCSTTKKQGRPILEARAIAVPLAELQRSGSTALDLYDSDVWERFDDPTLSNFRVRIGSKNHTNNVTNADARSIKNIADALSNDGGCKILDENLDYEMSIELIRQSLSRLTTSQRLQLSFAIGVTEGNIPLTNPSLIIKTYMPKQAVSRSNGPAKQEAQVNDLTPTQSNLGSFEQVAQEYKQFLLQLAEGLSKAKLESGWSFRLWNKCQDMITYTEIILQTGKDKNYSKQIYSLSEELILEMYRVEVFHEVRAAKELRHQTKKLVRFSPPLSLWEKAALTLLIIGISVLLAVAGWRFFAPPVVAPPSSTPKSQPRKNGATNKNQKERSQ